ncbi:uncharacterized protein LOC108623942 [Ceratina calcarata]|uniref:Uncharacterized protein LOC108623942 n=1 Tax=Ceratina calcarata TaxID=156304 RepID=A0AAJ7IWT1_9HYME|nr:uncharacterized protein LOC108623942 [Ceratina calcarata]
MSRLTSVYFIFIVIQLLVTLSTCQVDDRLNVLDEWRVQPPQIEIRLLKSHTSKDGNILDSIEYIFSNNNEYAESQKQENTGKKSEDVRTEEEKKTTVIPKFGGRTIFRIPKIQCPPGQQRDYLGECRDVFVP